ncbi:hypothetical protein JW721_02755 [Candidatus Micrarchaeota archaeon]|nr:hypothetical protein [Candidatus Micrarchaeota archaeon]
MGPALKRDIDTSVSFGTGDFSAPLVYAPKSFEEFSPEAARKGILGIGKRMEESWEGIALPPGKMEVTFAVIEGFLEAGAYLSVSERLNLVDDVIMTAGNCMEAYPDGREGAMNAALPLLGKLFMLEDKGRMLLSLTPYVKVSLEDGYELKKHFMLRLLARMDEGGAEIFWSSDSVRDSVLSAATSWNGELRRAARELIYAMTAEGNSLRPMMAPDADAFSSGRDFAIREGRGKVVAKIFEVAYVAGVRGSRWGMEVASAIILNMGGGAGRLYEGQVGRKFGVALEGCPATKDENLRALRRGRYLNRLLKDKRWILPGDKKGFPKAGVPGRLGEAEAVERARVLLQSMNRGLRIVQGRNDLRSRVRDMARA